MMTFECLGNRVISALQYMHVAYMSWLSAQSSICVGNVVHQKFVLVLTGSGRAP